MKQGGISGYGNAAVGALKAGSGIASLAGDSALAGSLGSAAGYVAAPVSIYNAVANYKSGATANDTLNGAEAGASVGSIIPGVGTLVGGALGAVAGAISAAFGGGELDPENANFDKFVGSYNKLSPAEQTQMMSQINPSTSFQLLAGVMDAKNDSSGHAEELEQVFGKGGENAFMTDMANKINSAISSGTVPKGASAQQIYSDVVTPWLSSKGVTVGSDSSTVKGAVSTGGGQEGAAMQGIITNLINQWQDGDITSSTPMGVAGQAISGLPTYGGASGTTSTSASTSTPAPRATAMTAANRFLALD